MHSSRIEFQFGALPTKTELPKVKGNHFIHKLSSNTSSQMTRLVLKNNPQFNSLVQSKAFGIQNR